MIVNQRIDLIEERLDTLFQLAQLGCERKYGSLCITSVQYQNFTNAANLSRQLSQYLAGGWSDNFEITLERLRCAVLDINATRVDVSVLDGFSSWFASTLSFLINGWVWDRLACWWVVVYFSASGWFSGIGDNRLGTEGFCTGVTCC